MNNVGYMNTEYKLLAGPPHFIWYRTRGIYCWWSSPGPPFRSPQICISEVAAQVFSRSCLYLRRSSLGSKVSPIHAYGVLHRRHHSALRYIILANQAKTCVRELPVACPSNSKGKWTHKHIHFLQALAGVPCRKGGHPQLGQLGGRGRALACSNIAAPCNQTH